MSLLTDFQNSAGGPRVVRFPDWADDTLPADLNLGGHSILGLTIDDLEFGVQIAHKVYAGPLSGPAAAPTFRLLEASEIGAQPQADALDTLSSADVSILGLNFLSLDAPEITASYPKVSVLGSITWHTASELASEVASSITSVAGVDFTTADEGAYSVTINGAVEFASDFYSGIGDVALVTSGPTSTLICPPLGTIWTTDNLNTNQQLLSNSVGASRAPSDYTCSSQKAVRAYIDNLLGIHPLTPGASRASATSVDLSGESEDVISITGTTNIATISVDEDAEFTIVFDDALTITASSTLLTKGGRDISVVAGDKAVVRGLAGDITQFVVYHDENNYSHDVFANLFLAPGANIGFGDLSSPYFDIGRSTDPLDGGMFIRCTLAGHLKMLKHDLSAGVTFNGSGLTVSRAQSFPDYDCTYVGQVSAPATAASTGSAGQIAYDSTHFYQCVATDTWKRATIAAW